MIVSKHGFKKRYAYGGSGIFDTIANFLTRIFTSSAAKQIASSAFPPFMKMKRSFMQSMFTLLEAEDSLTHIHSIIVFPVTLLNHQSSSFLYILFSLSIANVYFICL